MPKHKYNPHGFSKMVNSGQKGSCLQTPGVRKWCRCL